MNAPAPPRALKLHVVVRRDLTPGAQIAQAVHGQDAFRDALPGAHDRWHRESNTVAIHSASREELERLAEEAETLSVPYASFREEDLGGEITCVILDPYHPLSARMVRPSPLA